MDNQHSSAPTRVESIPGHRAPQVSADPLPQRDPGKTLRRTPATVGRPKPAPQRTTGATR